MRCYHINNMYMSGIHAGNQSAHAQTELAVKYVLDCDQHGASKHHVNLEKTAKDYKDWAINHKTMVVLNGGQQSTLMQFARFLEGNKYHTYAWAMFKESEEALNGALTNIAIILPEHMYLYSQAINKFIASDQDQAIEYLDKPNGFSIQLDFKRQGSRLQLTVNPTLNSEKRFEYSEFDIELINEVSRLKLM